MDVIWHHHAKMQIEILSMLLKQMCTGNLKGVTGQGSAMRTKCDEISTSAELPVRQVVAPNEKPLGDFRLMNLLTDISI